MTSIPLLDPVLGSAGDEVRAQFEAVRELLSDVPARLTMVGSAHLAAIAAAASSVVAAAEAARAAVVIEADGRGVIAESDHPRASRWVEQSCRDAGVPVARGQARQLHELTTACDGFDVAALRDAVTGGRVPLDAAATVAKVYRRLRRSIDYTNWEALLAALVGWAAEGASNHDLAALEDALIGQYGTPDALDDEHAHHHGRRELTTFHRDRTGRLTATLRLDPASEAAFSAAIASLSAPRQDESGRFDERTPGQRRADALLDLAARATTPAAEVPGSGAKARVVVTIPLTTLLSGLADAAIAEQDSGMRCRSDGSRHAPTSQGRAASIGSGDGTHGERGHGTTAFGQALSPTEVRLLACDAQIVPAVLGTRGELLELGRGKRLVTPGLAAALHLRDGGCTFPGCTAAPIYCDAHHIVYWALGGRTDLSNMALLCRHHHTEVHRRRHRATVDVFGVRWRRVDGTPIGNSPR